MSLQLVAEMHIRPVNGDKKKKKKKKKAAQWSFSPSSRPHFSLWWLSTSPPLSSPPTLLSPSCLRSFLRRLKKNPAGRTGRAAKGVVWFVWVRFFQFKLVWLKQIRSEPPLVECLLITTTMTIKEKLRICLRKTCHLLPFMPLIKWKSFFFFFLENKRNLRNSQLLSHKNLAQYL